MRYYDIQREGGAAPNGFILETGAIWTPKDDEIVISYGTVESNIIGLGYDLQRNPETWMLSIGIKWFDGVLFDDLDNRDMFTPSMYCTHLSIIGNRVHRARLRQVTFVPNPYFPNYKNWIKVGT